jgi:hypothetical protein
VRRALSVGITALAVAVAATGGGLAARPAAAAEPRFALLEQPAWVRADADVTFRLQAPVSDFPSDPGVELRIAVHAPVDDLEDLARAVAGERLGRRISTQRLPFTILPRDTAGTMFVTLGLATSPTTPRLNVSRTGVYPVEISVEHDATLASFITFLTVVDDVPDAGERLRVALVLRVASRPVRDASLDPVPGALPALREGGRVADLAALAGDAPVPLTLQVGPELLESWQALAAADAAYAEGAEQLAAAASDPANQLLPAPYVPTDLTALEAAGLGDALADQLVAGAETLEQLVGRTPDPRTAFVHPVDGATLARLRGLLTDRVVVRPEMLAGVDDPEEVATRPFTLAAGDGTVTAAATAPAIEPFLTLAAGDAASAHAALAALAVVATDTGDGPDGVVVAPADSWHPALGAMRTFLDGLGGHPLLRAVTIDDWFGEVPLSGVDGDDRDRDGAPPRHELSPHEPAAFAVTGADWESARSRLGSLAATVGADDPAVTAGTRALRLALGSTQPAAEAARHLRLVSELVRAVQDSVTVAQRRVTLTARRADIPISFTNRSGQPITALVRLESTKMLFPSGAERLVELPPGSSTQQFAVEARASGTFTMTVAVASPDGRLELGPPIRVTVRSAVFSGVGAALTIGALAFLALWWGNHFRRARRSRRLGEDA